MAVIWNTYVSFPGGRQLCVRERETSEESAIENTKRWIQNNLDNPEMPFTVSRVEIDPTVRNAAEEFCRLHGCD